jgi:hypothetical protein
MPERADLEMMAMMLADATVTLSKIAGELPQRALAELDAGDGELALVLLRGLDEKLAEVLDARDRFHEAIGGSAVFDEMLSRSSF